MKLKMKILSFLLVLPILFLSATFLHADTDVMSATVVEDDVSKIDLDCAESANILKDANWNFEMDGEFYWRLANTIDGKGSAYYYVMAITDELSHDGENSLMIDGVGGWANIYVPINVKRNTNYTFSMWVNATPGFGGMKNTIWKIGAMEDYDTNAEVVNTKSYYFTGDRGFDGHYDSEWRQVGIVVNSGENDFLAFMIGDGGGLVYFDELRFFETDNPNGVAETSVANLEKVRLKVEQEEAAKKSPTPAPTSPPATTAPTSSSPKSESPESEAPDQSDVDLSTDETSDDQSDAEGSDLPSDESAISTDTGSLQPSESEDGNVESSDKTSDSDDTGPKKGNTNWVLIIALIVLVLALSGFGLWYLKFRKK